MKKFALNAVAALVLVGSFTLVSCGNDTKTVDTESSNDSITTVDSLVIADSTVVDSAVVVDSVENVTVDSTAATTEEVK